MSRHRETGVKPPCGQGMEGTQPPGPVLTCLVTFQGSGNSGGGPSGSGMPCLCEGGSSFPPGLPAFLSASPPRTGTQNQHVT